METNLEKSVDTAEKRLAERREQRQQTVAISDKLADYLSKYRSPDEAFAELQMKIQSLDNELADTKRLLLDALCEKRELETVKADLQHTIEELSGRSGARGVSLNDDDEKLSDRAKKTIMHIRMERNEYQKGQIKSLVRSAGTSALNRLSSLRATCATVKSELSEQLTRISALLSSSLRATEQLAVTQMERNLNQELGHGPTENAGYLQMVTAMVKEQQRSMVLSSDHPVAQRLEILLGKLDATFRRLNAMWGAMRCFREGRAPQLEQLRRYADPALNLTHYSQQLDLVQSYVTHSTLVAGLFSEMRVPVLEKACVVSTTEATCRYLEKLSGLYDAMRLLRTPAASLAHNLGNAFRILQSSDAIQNEVAALLEEYRAASRQHTRACFAYVGSLISLTKKFTGQSSMNDDGSLQPLQYTGTCQHCQQRTVCEDCYTLQGLTGMKKWYFARHREILGAFNARRVKHLNLLSHLIDGAFGVLKKGKLLPLSCIARVPREKTTTTPKPQPLTTEGTQASSSGVVEVNARSAPSNVSSPHAPQPSANGPVVGGGSTVDAANVFLANRNVVSSENYFQNRRRLAEESSSNRAFLLHGRDDYSPQANPLDPRRMFEWDVEMPFLKSFAAKLPKRPSTTRNCGASDGSPPHPSTAREGHRRSIYTMSGSTAAPLALPSMDANGRPEVAEKVHESRVRSVREHQNLL